MPINLHSSRMYPFAAAPSPASNYGRTDKRSIIGLVSVLGTLVIIGWWLAQPDNLLFRLFRAQISDPRAKVIVGPYPTASDFRLLKQNGVTVIVSLLNPALPYESVLLAKERELARQYKMKFYSFPMSSVFGVGFGARYAQYARGAATVALREPGKVYLHCYLGLHRVKIVQEIIASLGGRYDHYRLRPPEREVSVQMIDAAQADFDQGHYRQVLNELKGVKLQTPQVSVLEGWSFYRLGRIAEADKSFHQALKESSSAWDAYTGLGYCALNRNQLTDASEEFTQVLRVNPHDPAAAIGLGIVRYREGRDAEAAKYLERGLASGPPNPEAKQILSKMGY